MTEHKVDVPESADPAADAQEEGRRLTQQLAHQWALLRAERRAERVEPVRAGPSNFSRAQVPWGVDLAAAWSWRFLVIVAAGYAVAWTLGYFAVIVMPGRHRPADHRAGDPAGPLDAEPGRAAGALLDPRGRRRHRGVAALLTFAGQQVANGATDLAGPGRSRASTRSRTGSRTVRSTPATPRSTTTSTRPRTRSRTWTEGGTLLARVTEFGAALSHVLAGFFIVLFSTYFFLADGDRIWAWFVRLAPRASRERVDSSGRVAWVSLTQFVRATVIVALADALGIMAVAAILGVPFVLAIGVLVFLGAFIPMVGAAVAGSVAVLVALVDQGPYVALFMLLGVIAVQQIEGHILQPFLMGRFVSIHPLGIIVAIGCGVLVAGIAGALIAVPFAAALNAVVQHLAGFADPGALEEGAIGDDVERGPSPAEDTDD